MAMQAMTNLIFRSIAPRDIRHIGVPDLPRADGLVAEVCRQMALEFQLVPPVTLHHPQPRLFAGLWAASREAYVAGRDGRELREAVGAGVSLSNGCPYCVDVHVAMLHGLGATTSANALTADGGYADHKLAAVVEWAKATLTPDAAMLRNPPFSASEAPRIVGTAVLFHYINRMVHLFLPDSPLPIPASLGWLKRNANTLFGLTVGREVVTRVAGDEPFPLAGEPADLPVEFAWARSDVRVAAALALFAKTAEEAGAVSLHEDVRLVVGDAVDRWRGEPPGLGRSWVEHLVADLPEYHRTAARLALLTALASYQVTDDDVAAFRARYPSDATLVGATGWASFRAMKRIAGWLNLPVTTASSET